MMSWQDLKDAVDMAVEAAGKQPHEVAVEWVDVHAPARPADIEITFDATAEAVRVRGY